MPAHTPMVTPPPEPRGTLKRIEGAFESALFAGRWLMAPVYVGLLIVLGAIAVKFIEELVITLPLVLVLKERELVMFLALWTWPCWAIWY